MEESKKEYQLTPKQLNILVDIRMQRDVLNQRESDLMSFIIEHLQVDQELVERVEIAKDKVIVQMKQI